MATSRNYPPQFAKAVVEHLRRNSQFHGYGPRESGSVVPALDVIQRMVEVAYAASLQQEESRRLLFRIAYMAADISTPIESQRIHWVPFGDPRLLNTSEIRRLSPAVDFNRTMICVKESVKGELLITGLLTMNADMHELASGAKMRATSLPPDMFNVSSTRPGAVAANWGDFAFMRLADGQILKTGDELLDSNGPLVMRLKQSAEESSKRALREMQESGEDTQEVEADSFAYFSFLNRVIFSMRRIGHGGSLLIVPDTLKLGDPRLSDVITIKYQVTCDDVRSMLVDWSKSVMRARSRGDYSNDKISINALYSLEREIGEIAAMADFVAHLTAVDGAVVITDRLSILGFGGEITANSPSLTHVTVEGVREPRAITDYGTRHRSMFRVCSSLHSSIGFIVSQDGETKVVMHNGTGVHLWPSVAPTRET